MKDKKSKEIKKKKKLISLFLGLVLFLSGAVLAAGPFVPAVSSLTEPLYGYTVIADGLYAPVVPGAFLAFLGIFILTVRRRRPFSLLLVPYMAFIYASVAVAARFMRGEKEPAFIIDRLSGRPAFVFLILILEVILFMLLIVITSSLNAGARKRMERRKLREEKAAEAPQAKATEDAEKEE